MRFQLAINEACIIKEAFYDAKYGKRMLPLAKLFDYGFHIFRLLNVRMNSFKSLSYNFRSLRFSYQSYDCLKSIMIQAVWYILYWFHRNLWKFLFSDFRAFQIDTKLYTYTFPFILYPLNHISFLASIYITVAMAYERYIAVCRPLHYRDVTTRYTVQRRTIGYVT